MTTSASASFTSAAIKITPKWTWLAIAFAAIWLATLGVRHLLNPDEGRYAEIPREMVASGDWLTPRLNDLKYFEKPPLQYWATAAIYEVFGATEFASRLWCGLTGLAGVFFAGIVGLRLFGAKAGLITASLLAGSLMYIALGHLNTLDMSLSFFMQITIGAFLLAQQTPEKSTRERRWMLLAWAMAALGFLTKGLEVVVLPGLALVIYSAVEREWSAWRRLHIVAGLPLFLAIAAPWLIAMSIVNPEFPHFFFIHEHFERFLTDVHERVEPWWFFIPFLLIGTLPWTTLAASAIVTGWRADKSASSGDNSSSGCASGFRYRRFLIVWFAAVMIFFSASHSKLIPYILPVIPALALIVGDSVTRMTNRALRHHMLIVAMIWTGAIAYVVSGPLPTVHGARPALLAELFAWLGTSFGIMLMAAVSAWWFLKREQMTNAMAALGAGTFLGFSVLLVGFNLASEVRSGFDLAEQIKPHLSSNKPFYSIDDYDQTLPFYLQQPMTLVAYKNELDFGLQQEPQKGIPDYTAFKNAWSRDPSGSLAVMPHDTYTMLAAEQVAMTIIGRNFDLIAVMKP